VTSPVVDSPADQSFGAVLRRTRHSARMSLADLSNRVHYSRSHLSKVETGLTVPGRSLVEACDAALDARGELVRLAEYLGRAPRGALQIDADRGSVTHTQGSPSTSLVRGLHRVGIVPRLADCWQERSADYRLRAASVESPTPTPVVVLGMGGVGKTQLAAAMAHWMSDAGQVDLLVWVSAGSSADIVMAYAQAAIDVVGFHGSDAEQLARRFLAWLAGTSRSWLVVLDNVMSVADLRGWWPPATSFGRTVVTTRRRDSALLAGRTVIDVDQFSPQESVAYLLSKLGLTPDRAGELSELADDLGHLPLALAQAATYMLDRHLTVADYRARLAARRLTELVPSVEALPDDQAHQVSAAVSLAIASADQMAPAGLTQPILRLVALLDPDGIPIALFATTAVLDFLARSRSAEAVAAEDARDALHALNRLSLVTLDPNSDTVRVHSVTQRVVREQLQHADAAPAALAAADGLLAIWPEQSPIGTEEHACCANALALFSVAGDMLWQARAGVHPVLFKAGHSLGAAGLARPAGHFYGVLLAAAVKQLGNAHPDTSVARSNFDRWQAVSPDKFDLEPQVVGRRP
jgi:transcriptional regulator with XRE-family HTH domain